MFGFVCRDSKIIDGIHEKNAFYVLKLIKKYKKQLFRSIQEGDRDCIFSNMILDIIAKIQDDKNIKLDELIKEYSSEVNTNKISIEMVKIYNDRDLLKYVIKNWEEAEDTDYCEVFNSLLENEIAEEGNVACYSMIKIKNERIDIKQFSNDFSIYYQDEDDCYNGDFKGLDHIEIKRNTNNQITGASLVFKDGFSVGIWANTITDSDNIERLQSLAQKHGVIKESKDEFKTVS